VTIFTLTIFIVGFWSLAFYSSYSLQHDMEHALGEQQFSTVSIILIVRPISDAVSGISTERIWMHDKILKT